MSRPALAAPAAEAVRLDDAEVLLVTFEQAGVRGSAFVPPGLAPTTPTLVTLLVVRAPGGQFGPWTLAQVRLSCRSGARARALVVGQQLEATPETAAALAAGWGIGDGSGASPVRLHRGYDAIRATATGLDVTLLDPSPIDPHDVQYVANLHPVATAVGERLAQVEVEVDAYRAERGRPVLHAFDGAAWGDERLRPTHPVAATIAVGSVTLPALRFLLDPDLPPHQGTEMLDPTR